MGRLTFAPPFSIPASLYEPIWLIFLRFTEMFGKNYIVRIGRHIVPFVMFGLAFFFRADKKFVICFYTKEHLIS